MKRLLLLVCMMMGLLELFGQTRYTGYKGTFHPMVNFLNSGPYVKGYWNQEVLYVFRWDDHCLGQEDCERAWGDADIRLEPLSKGEITRFRNSPRLFSFRTEEDHFDFAVWANAGEGLFLVDTIRLALVDSGEFHLSPGNWQWDQFLRMNPQEFDPVKSYEEWFEPGEEKVFQYDPNSRFSTGIGISRRPVFRGQETPLLAAMRDENNGRVFQDSLSVSCINCEIRRGEERGIWWLKPGEEDEIYLQFSNILNGIPIPFEKLKYKVEDPDPEIYESQYSQDLFYRWKEK